METDGRRPYRLRPRRRNGIKIGKRLITKTTPVEFSSEYINFNFTKITDNFLFINMIRKRKFRKTN